MAKRRKSLFIFGSMLIGVVTVLATFLILVGTGVIDTKSRDLVFTSSDASAVYSGTALTSDEWELTTGELKNGHRARVTVSGSQLNVGTSDNHISVVIVDEQGADVSDGYNITCITGKLTVTPCYYEIKSASAEKVYDGTPLTAERYSVVSGELPSNHDVSVSYSASVTNVGVVQNAITARIRDSLGRDVTSNFELVCTSGKLEVTKRAAAFKSSGASKTYDGTPLTAETAELSSGTLVNGHRAEYEFSASATAASIVDNYFTVKILAEDDTDVTSNYDITSIYGLLTVTKQEITIATGDGRKQYDGTPLTVPEYDLISGSIVDGENLVISITGSQTFVGQSYNTFDIDIVDADENSTLSNYSITSVNGTLAVIQRAITIATEGGQKPFDGTPLTVPEYDLIAGSIVDGENLVVTVTGSQTNAGQSANAFDVDILGEDDSSTALNYEISSICGLLVVIPREITVETDTDTKIYDGTPLTYDYWRVVTDREYGTYRRSGQGQELVGGGIITVNVFGSQLNVGHSDNNFVIVSIVDADGVDCSANYDVSEAIGTLTVTPRPLTVQSASASKNYDGKPLTANDDDCWFIASYTTLASGHDIAVVISGERIEAGESPNTIAEVIITDGEIDVTANYDILCVPGALVVKGRNGTQLSGGAGNDSSVRMWLYSENSEAVYLRTVSYGDYNYGGFYYAEDYGETINHGDISNASYNYLTTFAMDNSSLTTSPLQIKLKTGTAFVVPYYTPYSYTNDGVTALNADTLQSSDVQYTGTATEYTVYRYAYSYVWDNGAAVNNKLYGTAYSEYELAYREFVKDYYLTIPDDTLEFMQSIIDAQGFDKNNDDIISAVASYIQNAANYSLAYDQSMDYQPDVVVAFLRDYKLGVCRHYASAATMLFRALGIPARYTVGYLGYTVPNAWAAVTGLQAHAWVEVYIDGTGWVAVEVTGGYADDDNGDDENDDNGDDNNNNDPNAFAVKPIEAYKEYDGTDLYPMNIVQGLSKLVSKGYGYEVVISGSQREIGYGVSVIDSLKIYDPEDKCIYTFDRASGTEINNSDYKFTIGNGKLHVYEYRVKVATGSASKPFDGTPLVNNSYSFVGGLTLQPGHSFAEVKAGNIASIMGSITTIGTVPNVFNATIVDDATGEDITYRYRIEVDYGELTVNAMAITIRTKSASASMDDLDGGALTCNEYCILDEGGRVIRVLDEDGNSVDDLVGGVTYTLVYGGTNFSITVEIAGSQSRPGRSQNRVSSVTITNSDGESVKDNFGVNYDLGNLSVNR